ncbi:hypothetical protein VNO78_21944 [Psophocarpus tetragonolobus]|uniref:Uncharacterized protein n=1 Tax=Psophocarpus tetragonolobus TaxID=3891 RepID=A0AAN9SCT2_PSOTE
MINFQVTQWRGREVVIKASNLTKAYASEEIYEPVRRVKQTMLEASWQLSRDILYGLKLGCSRLRRFSGAVCEMNKVRIESTTTESDASKRGWKRRDLSKCRI